MSKKSPFIGLPKLLRIGPFDVEVVPKIFEDGDDWGEFSHAKLTIKLNIDQPTGIFAADTLLHELFHAIYKIYGLDQRDNEERLATVMASGWVQVYRDNPGLLQWLTKVLR